MSPRQTAIANGDKYYHGRKCIKHKNNTKRFTCGGKCVECATAIQKRYYKNNKETYLARTKKDHEENRPARLQTMREYHMSHEIDGTAIYALSLKSAPTEYFYVGQSKNTTKRLLQHKSDAKRMNNVNSAKERIIRKALRAKDEILLTIMEVVPKDVWSDAENDWMTKLEMAGHELTNAVCGTIIGEAEHVVTQKRKPKTMKDFHELKWDKESFYAKKGEEVAIFGGGELFRKGKKDASMRIRFKHREYGEHEVNGVGMEEMGQTLLRMLTHGTPENEYMTSQHEQHMRLRGNVL